MKRQFLAALLIIIPSIIFSQAGYYSGDGGKGKKVLVYSSKIENGNSDGTDTYIPKNIHKALVNNLAVYSNLDVIDFSEKENIKQIQQEYEKSEYDDKDQIQVGKFFQAKYCISTTTLVTTGSGEKKYSLTVTLSDIETGRSLGGFNSTVLRNESQYLSFAAREAACEILPLLGVQLTPSGKRLLLSGTSNSVIVSLETAQSDYDAITRQLNAITLEQSKVSLEKLTAMDAEAKKAQLETTRQLLIQQQKNAEETVKRLKEEEKRRQEEQSAKEKRSEKAQVWIDSNTEKAEKRAAKIRDEKMKGLTVSQKINVIETEKQILWEAHSAVQEQIDAYNSLRDAEMQKEISARLEVAPRTAEIDQTTGELNETGRKILEQDIARIRQRYQILKENNAAAIEKNTSKSNNRVAKKIDSDMEDLQDSKFTANSLKEDGLYFMIEDYDGDSQAWNYFISFSFAGTTIFTTADKISYKEMTSQKAPSISALLDEKTRNNYYDTVDSYDSFFRMNIPFVYAKLYYRVKAADYTLPSLYYIILTKIEFINATSNSVIKTRELNIPIEYQCLPKINVDFRTKSQIEEAAAIQRREEQEATERIQLQNELEEQQSIQSARFSWGGFTVFPTTWNYYKLDKKYGRHDIQTAGYTLSLGLGNYLWIGGNAEGGDLRGIYDYIREQKDAGMDARLSDFDGWTYTLTFQYGVTYKVFEHLRINLMGEAGKVFKKTGYGFGAGIDIPFKEYGLTASWQREHTKDFGWVNKFSAGIQTLF